MKSERVTQAWEFYRDNCQGYKETMRQEFRKLDEYVSSIETENAKLQERVEWLDGECRKSMGASHKFFEMVGEYQKENAKLRELVLCLLTCSSDSGDACDKCPVNGGSGIWDFADFCDSLLDRVRKLGIEV